MSEANELNRRIRAAEEVFWINEKYDPAETGSVSGSLSAEDIDEAAQRLQRFAPVIMHYFPETRPAGGIIESPLSVVPEMKAKIKEQYGVEIGGSLWIKQDSDLAVSGSVKARGGIYEVLKHTEDLALQEGLLSSFEDDYEKLVTEEARALFSRYKMQVGSTGNLGMSIGIMSAALGYEAIVHMSADAKQWKKDLLRSRGATVIEYDGKYEEAVKNGRKQSDEDPTSYFVDDENSVDLFCGYATAGKRLRQQLEEKGIAVDEEHPLIVSIPCGVGGAPGGITWGLKQQFGAAVHIFFAEPVQAPCMLIGLESGKYNAVSVEDYGLSGQTEADGLAVGRCSSLAAKIIHPMLSGEATIQDENLYPFMRQLLETEQIFIEPSSCAGFMPLLQLYGSDEGKAYLREHDLEKVLPNTVNIVWATGGSMMPQEEREKMLQK